MAKTNYIVHEHFINTDHADRAKAVQDYAEVLLKNINESEL